MNVSNGLRLGLTWLVAILIVMMHPARYEMVRVAGRVRSVWCHSGMSRCEDPGIPRTIDESDSGGIDVERPPLIDVHYIWGRCSVERVIANARVVRHV